MNEEEQLISEAKKVAEAMEHYGGGFFSALGKAIYKADLDNLRRIHDAFPEKWKEYLDTHYHLSQSRM